MKRMIVDTLVGRVALSLRDTITLVKSSYANPEDCGAMANDLVAGTLVGSLCQDRKTFIDVGAHIGSVVARVAHHCPTARIVAVEAVPEKVANLRRKFPRVVVHSCAVGASEGEVTFFVDSRRSGCSSLVRPDDSDQPEPVEITVPLRTLDGIITPDAGQVDVIKIDVEGAELGVLRGGERLIAANRPTIMFESGPDSVAAPGWSKEDLWQWFADREYAVLVPNRVAHTDPGLGRDGFLESHLYPRRTLNYFAVPRERRFEVRDRARGLLKVEVKPL